MRIIKTAIVGWKAINNFDNRWQILFNRLFFRKFGTLIYRKNDMQILIDHEAGDASGTRDCIVSDMYKKYLKFLGQRRPLKVIDCGANGGGFPIMLIANGWELRKLVSVEMNPNTFVRLQFNLARNVRATHAVLNMAICADGRTMELDLGSGGTSDSIYSDDRKQQTKRTRYLVCGTTLDNLISCYMAEERVIDICKVDIEGAEHEIFDGNTCGLLARVRLLIIEIHGSRREATERCVARIVSFGFVLVGHEGESEGVYCFQNTMLK